MNKYPGIYRAEDGGEYIYANKDSYYCFLRELWDESDSEDNHENDKNITAEYLTNTYGKVESKEHAEFIVKLAEVNAFEVTIYNESKNYFAFVDGVLLFLAKPIYDKDKRKPITIPLPPKEKLMESQKEWPQVGDEVLINDLKCNVIGIDGDAYWIKRKKTGTYDIAKRDQLKKPPTPKDELDRKLYDFFQCNSEEDLAEAIINGEIEGLEYKPQ